MRLRASIACLVIAALLDGCSLLSGGKEAEPTVGSLGTYPWPRIPASVEARDYRQAAIQHYQAFLAESPQNDFVPEAMRRLADLQLVEEQQALAQGRPPAGNGRSRAAALYEELLTRFPDHKHNDSALYQLARAHEQSGDLEPAMAALSDYARKFQNGDKIDEVQFRRGEYLFVRRDYAAAERAYQAVLDQSEKSIFHQQALYKIGWARFKQNHYLAALDAYMQLLDEALAGHDSADLPDMERAERERLDDTLRAISLSFSYLGDSGQVERYFAKRGGRSYEPLIYARLAGLHLAKERFTDAAETYRRFATSHPQHREAPLFHSRVIDVFRQAGFNERVLQEKQAFVERYEPASDYWKQQDPADSPEVLARVQRHLRDVARHYHALAQEEKKPAIYARAAHWYELYLRAFPDSGQAPYMNFLYAELLSDAGRHGDAARQYERTAYDYGNHEKAAEAGYAALLAYQKHEATLKGRDKADWHRAGIGSALRFAGRFPQHGQALPVRVLAAQQLFALQEYLAASAAAEPVIERADAPPKLQRAAWLVIAHVRFELHDYPGAEAAYRQVLARTDRKHEQRAAVLDKLAASIYKQGEQARDEGKLAAAAGHFLRIADAAPGSAIIATARYDAAAAFIALKQWPDAIHILEQWRSSYPEHKLQADVTRKLAVLYQENRQPLRAAAEFQRIAASEKDPRLKREAAWTAATLYQQAGRHQQAIDAYKRFVQQFPQPVEQALEARFQLVRLYEQTGDSRKRRYWQRKIVEADRSAGRQRSARTRFLAAHARLALVETDLAAYRSVKLREPLKKNLERKKKFMQATIKGYTEAAAYQVAEVTTQATYRIGELYADFGRALMESERPRGLNAEDLEQYEILLEEQAFPFEEKAIEIHETNARRIAGGLYDNWVKKSMAQLAELLPVRYAKQEKGENFVAVLE